MDEFTIGCHDCHLVVKLWGWGFGLSREITDKWNRRMDESEEYELAFVNGWLDSARFDDRLTEEEQDACWTVLNAIARIQEGKK